VFLRDGELPAEVAGWLARRERGGAYASFDRPQIRLPRLSQRPLREAGDPQLERFAYVGDVEGRFLEPVDSLPVPGGPEGLAVDAAGQLVVALRAAKAVALISMAEKRVVTLYACDDHVYFAAADAQGRVVAAYYNRRRGPRPALARRVGLELFACAALCLVRAARRDVGLGVCSF
jgi:hypothetical protein